MMIWKHKVWKNNLPNLVVAFYSVFKKSVISIHLTSEDNIEWLFSGLLGIRNFKREDRN